MPLLIDGNNLMFAMAEVADDVGREGLCRWLERLADGGESLCVVFDGPARGGQERTLGGPGLEVVFSERRSADAVILERIADCSAPKRLRVVSTDREIRTAARRRRCEAVRSEDFAREIVRGKAARKPADGTVKKPDEMTDEQREQWYREFEV